MFFFTFRTPDGTGSKTLRWSAHGICEWSGSIQNFEDAKKKKDKYSILKVNII